MLEQPIDERLVDPLGIRSHTRSKLAGERRGLLPEVGLAFFPGDLILECLPDASVLLLRLIAMSSSASASTL
jgi:hypothetical protein